ncbi:MAG TPA: hypothetical protein DHD79_06125 [Firmicutes bacterium]|nr:hypothetical protein [Bacillota bacterium]HBL67544.1 hypothetical protein [Bacillota bacterium]HCF90191.1 hypothetical protein [Bacillota bacterium]HCX70803.1 hypothetical protein [Bacillota bacterium]
MNIVGKDMNVLTKFLFQFGLLIDIKVGLFKVFGLEDIKYRVLVPTLMSAPKLLSIEEQRL